MQKRPQNRINNLREMPEFMLWLWNASGAVDRYVYVMVLGFFGVCVCVCVCVCVSLCAAISISAIILVASLRSIIIKWTPLISR